MSSEPPLELAVRVHNLVKDYGAHRAVDGLSFGVPQGEFFGFLGPNGAGKSTTIRILCGLLRPTSGEAEVAGEDVVRHPVAVKAKIGVLPEEPVLYERLSGREMLWYAGRLYGLDGATIERRSQDLLELMSLSRGDANKAIVDYSMGMRKKVGLACALLHRPDVVALDPPILERKLGLAVDLEEHPEPPSRVDVRGHSSLGGNSRGLLGGLGCTLGSLPVHGLFEVALVLEQRLAAIENPGTSLRAQLLDLNS